MTKHRSIFIEVTVAAVAIAVLIYLLRSMLLFGQTTVGHDNILWHYPGFQFYAENILEGHFPLWNPFTHGGEPFYPLLGHLRLLDPVTFVTVSLGQFLSQDLVILFNWDRVIAVLVAAFGIYIVFRPWAKHLLIRLSLIPILLYSSIMLGTFQQDAILGQFICIPYITFFLLRIVYYKDYRWRNWFGLAGFIGLNWQSYMFTGTWIFLLFIALGLAVFRRDLLINLFKANKVARKLTVAAVIIGAMGLPNITLLFEQDEYVYPPRMVDVPYQGRTPIGGPIQYESGPDGLAGGAIRMPYDIIRYTGTHSTVWDFIQAISPDGNPYAQGPHAHPWGNPSEAFIYLGLLPWAIAILGFVAGNHELKRVWLLVNIGFGLVMLGPDGGLHWLLYQIYPPLWFVRHTHTLVMIFVFSSLYFYVLGCNHLLTSWRHLFFERGESKGVFGYFIKNLKLRMAIASSLFSSCFIFSVYTMTQLVYPQTNYLFLCVALILAVGWVLRKDMGRMGLFGSLILTPIIVVLILSPNRPTFLIHTMVFLGLPFLLLLLVRTIRTLPQGLLACIPFAIVAVLTVDLIYNFGQLYVYRYWKHPKTCLDISTMPQKPRFLENRLPYPPYTDQPLYDQTMRYLSLVYRQPFVFSAVKVDEKESIDALAKRTPNLYFTGLKNGSFESWVISPRGLLQPKHWYYYQDGTGGCVGRYTAEDGVKEGSVSVWISPSSRENSYIQYEISEVQELQGLWVSFPIWVKSSNKIADAVQVSIEDDGQQMLVVKSYGNSGIWEHIEVKKFITSKAKKVLVTCNVKANASHGAYFDGAAIATSDLKLTIDFEYALNAKRWNSFLLPRKYFDLIHSDIVPRVLEEMFAVGKPMLQFKQGFLEMEDEDIPAYLEQLGEEESVKLLKETVIVHGPVGPELATLRGSPGVRKSHFEYSITGYDYNSLNMTISAEADGILYWAEGYDKDWHAFIGGKEVPIYRANINFKAIGLPQGENEVSFVYDPFWFKLALFFFYGPLMACILVSLTGLPTKLRHKETQHQIDNH